MNFGKARASALLCCWIGLLSLELVVNAQPRPPVPALRGIITWPGRRLALLEDTNASSSYRRDLVLGPGERDGDVEVYEVNRNSVRVRVAASGLDLELCLPASGRELASPPPDSSQACSVQLESARLSLVLAVYQELAGRTLLRPSRLPAVELTVAPTNTTGKFHLLRVLDRALAENGISIQPHREKFALVAAREADFTKIKPELWDSVAAIPSRESVTNESPELPPGMIHFPNTDINQVLRVFEELAGLTIVRPSTLPLAQFTLHSQTSLTRMELKYAFAATLALNDLSLLPAGDKFLLLFPTIQADQISQMLARIKPRAASTNSISGGGTMNFPGSQLDQVARIYQDLLGQAVEIAPSTPRPVLFFQSQAPLNREAALYGIELLFGLNGLSVVPQENGPGVKIVPTGSLVK